VKRRWIAALVAALALLLGVVLANGQTAPPAAAPATENPATEPTNGGSGVEEGKGGNPETAEQAETTDARLEALAEARANGTLRVETATLGSSPAPGWAGEFVVNRTADDWEPAVATDPNAPYVYVVTTRYAVKPCKGNCP
jgi:hypothetical protein